MAICKHCNEKEIEYHWGDAINARIRKEQACFSCDYFLGKEKAMLSGKEPYVKINGNLYHVGDENAGPGFRGFGGSQWIIRLRDSGIMFMSTNMWDNSTGPKWFQDKFPNNADVVHCEGRGVNGFYRGYIGEVREEVEGTLVSNDDARRFLCEYWGLR